MFEPLLNRLRERGKNPARRTDTTDVVEAELYHPVTAAVLAEAEGVLGFSLVPLLRSIYLEIGIGGFGPGYELIGLRGGPVADNGESVVELYQSFHQADPEAGCGSGPTDCCRSAPGVVPSTRVSIAPGRMAPSSSSTPTGVAQAPAGTTPSARSSSRFKAG